VVPIYRDEPARAGARPAKRRRDCVDPLLISGQLAASASQFEGSGELIAGLRQAPLFGSDCPRPGGCASPRIRAATGPEAGGRHGCQRARKRGSQDGRRREKYAIRIEDGVHRVVSTMRSACWMPDID
jgi:hypothetical protein